MTAATAPKRKPTKAQPSAPADLEQLEQESLRQALAEYRHAVAEAADGKQHDGAEMAVIRAAMNEIGIPAYCWKRDIDAERRMRDFNQSLDELIAGQGQRDIEVQQLTSEIQHIERRLAEAKGRRHELTKVVPSTISGYSQRIRQLRSENPHIFEGVDAVVRERMAAKAKQAATFRADWGS